MGASRPAKSCASPDQKRIDAAIMARSKNTKHVAHIDCPGGGQVWVDGTTLYIGHMRQPTGTTIVDISDPQQPRTLARIEIPPG